MEINSAKTYEIHEVSQSGEYLYITVVDSSLLNYASVFMINCRTEETKVLRIATNLYKPKCHERIWDNTLILAEKKILQKVLEDI